MIVPAPIRDTIFISKATPGDDAFALWLAPRLEAAGYRVFADIVGLDTGDGWRRKLTDTLQKKAIKMVLCCSDTTLAREGVIEEIEIAKDLTKSLGDPNFILPLRMAPFQKLFGVGSLQYIDFEPGWALGFAKLLRSLEKQNVPKASAGKIQSQWQECQRRMAVNVEQRPEVLTSNWLRILTTPDNIHYLSPKNPFEEKTLASQSTSFRYPLAPYNRGFISFASPFDFEEHFTAIGPFEAIATIPFSDFIADGCSDIGLEAKDAKNIVLNLLRQAWEKHLSSRNFKAHGYSNSVSYHATDAQVGLNRRVSWGRQGQRRKSVLRNIARKKEWAYGVSVTPSLFPWPHLRLKSRVLFSDLGINGEPARVIDDKRAQHTLRRGVCSGWRNKAWHGRLMAFMEVLAGDSPYVDMAVGDGLFVTADAMPVQVTSPVTARQRFEMDEDATEEDPTTITGGAVDLIDDQDEAELPPRTGSERPSGDAV